MCRRILDKKLVATKAKGYRMAKMFFMVLSNYIINVEKYLFLGGRDGYTHTQTETNVNNWSMVNTDTGYR